MYVMPEDVHFITADTIPYELDVDIIKDCTNFKQDISDVFAILDKTDENYPKTLKKVGYLTKVNEYFS